MGEVLFLLKSSGLLPGAPTEPGCVMSAWVTKSHGVGLLSFLPTSAVGIEMAKYLKCSHAIAEV